MEMETDKKGYETMKKVLMALVGLVFATVFICSVSAATVYVQSGSSGTGMSESTPVGSLSDAFGVLDGKGGEIVLLNTVQVSGTLYIPEQSEDLTITAKGSGSLTVTEGITLAKNENGNRFIFDMPLTAGTKTLLFFGGFNSVYFTENFQVDGTVDFYGGVDAEDGLSSLTTSQVEENAALNRACITELPYSITVENGNFGVFAGGNRRSAVTSLFGSIAAKLDVTIAGGTFTYQGSRDASDALKIDQAFSLSGMSILADDATLTITGGTFDTPIYVLGYLYPNKTEASASSQVTNSDAKYYAADGDVTVDIRGGSFTENCYEISAAQQGAAFNLLLRGNYAVRIGADAVFAGDTMLDATQVKAYVGSIAAATLVTEQTVSYRRFDSVNGESKTYNEPIRIACVGDSITQGTNSGNFSVSSYPAKLYTKLHGEGRDVVVSNFGCGGWTVMNYDGKYYRAGLAYTLSVHETDADIVILGLGTNDSRFFNTVGQHDHFREEYKDLLLSYTELESTKSVYATSAIYRFDKLAIESSQIVRRHQEEAVRALRAAGNEKAVYVDLYELTLAKAHAGKLLSADDLHPNAAGYTAYADAIYDVLYGSGATEQPLEKRTEIYLDEANGRQGGAGTAEDPVKYLADALELADRDAEEVTLYIVGTYSFADRETSTDTTNTPYDLQKLRIVGVPDADGNKAVWSLSTKYLYFNCDTELDNIILRYPDTTSSAIYMYCCFNNVTFTETFETAAYCFLFAGHNVYNEDPTAKRYTPVESVSSDKDIAITVLGGKFYYFYGGNRHYPSDSIADKAPYGTYSGNMTVTVGEKVVFSSKYASALSGMNYLTGSITANIASWNAGQPILEYSPITTNSKRAQEYNETGNTGSVTLHTSLDNRVIRAGDVSEDGRVDLEDALLLLRYKLNGVPANFESRAFYDRTEIELLHVLRALRMLIE